MSEARTVFRALRAIGLAGLAAGVLDIGYILIYYAIQFPKVGSQRVLQGVAAGLIGRDAAAAGALGTAALGLGLHFFIALTVAAIFYAASRVLRVLVARPFISGALYGVAVWLVMNLVALPLSATPPKTFPGPLWIPVLVAHVFCVGLPIALVIRRCGPPSA